MLRIVIFSFLVNFALASEGGEWKYGETEKVYGPQDWNKVSTDCGKSAQSPIDIVVSAAESDPGLEGLEFTSDNKNGDVSGTLTNNGHAPTLSIAKSKGTATLTGGPLGASKYQLEQLHVHFGCGDDRGSEHTVNSRAFSGELHLVTYNKRYSDFETAADKPDGLSVIGVFLKRKTSKKNSALKKISRALRKIRVEGTSAPVNKLKLYKLVPQLNDLSKASFFSYKGSLTTPPCYQSVSWIVLKTPVAVDKKLLRALRKLKNNDNDSLCDNFRPTQPLNGRTVSAHSVRGSDHQKRSNAPLSEYKE